MTRLSEIVKKGQEAWCGGGSPDSSPSRGGGTRHMISNALLGWDK